MTLLHRIKPLPPPILYPSCVVHRTGLKTCDLCPYETSVWVLMDAHMSVHITGKWSGA